MEIPEKYKEYDGFRLLYAAITVSDSRQIMGM